MTFQESSQAAVLHNKTRRAASHDGNIAEFDSNSDGGNIAPHVAPPVVRVSLNNSGDERYAISVAELDEARNSHDKGPGNWMCANDEAFKSEQRMIEHDGPEDDLAEQESVNCGTMLGPGLCQAMLKTPTATPEVLHTYNKLLNHAKDALRWARSIRREKGFQPDHLLLLLVKDQDDGTLEQLEIHVLARVSFSPFDGTAIEFKWTSADTAHVCRTPDGFPIFRTLPCLMYKFAQERCRETVSIRIARYKAVSLNGIRIQHDTVQLPTSAIGGDAGDDDESSSCHDQALVDRLNLLKRAAGIATSGNRGRGRGRSRGQGQSRGSGRSRGSRGRKRTLTEHEPDVHAAADDDQLKQQRHDVQKSGESDGVAGEVHDEIMMHWGNAIAIQSGPLKKDEPARKASKPTPSSSSSSIPIVSYTEPWKDDKGYCWVYNEETKKPYHLGHILSDRLVLSL